jgi:putative peptidoglycan lipid II flippase
VAAGFQNANNRFVVARLYEPTVALVSFLSLVSIGSHDGVAALAGSQTLGYAVAALVLLVSVVFHIGSTRPLPLWPVCKRLFSLCWPTAGALVLFRANAAVNKAFASVLPGGSLASLGYAERLYLLPVTLVIATIVTFHYTRAAELAVRNDIEGIARQTVRASLKTALVLIPLTVGIGVFAAPLVRCTLQHGAFDQHASAMTAAVLAVYCIALLPHVMMELLTATMRGLGNMKAPMLAGVATLGVNALLCAFLVRRMGAPGAAAALVGGYVAGALVMTGLVVRSFRRARLLNSSPAGV